MRQVCCLVFGLVLASASFNVLGSEIARWVDADGITHFGNPQFAPPQAYEAVYVEPTNGMTAPQAPVTRITSTGPAVVTLERPRMRNKAGFRGYSNRPSATQNRRR